MLNNYKYGTPEYSIQESIEKLQVSLKEIEKWRQDIGFVMPVEYINLVGRGFANIADYFKNGKSYSYYNPNFDKTKKDHIETCVKNAKFWLEQTKNNIEIIHQKNLPAIENNKILIDKINNIFKNLGISSTYSTYDYKTSRSSTKTETKHRAGYLLDLERCVKVSDGYESQLTSLKSYEARINQWESDSLKEIEKVEKEKIKSDKELRKLALAVELAKKYQITYSTNEELIDLIEEKERENFRNKNYPDGTEIDQSCCQECSSWTVGEHRCSCGNRRMYLEIEGNFVDGYYGNPMAD